MTLIIIVICIAFVFDFLNGFHDAANSIATVVSTRVLTPGQAVLWAAFFNFVAVFGFGTAVAKTVGAGMVDISVVTTQVVLSALIGAIIWDIITWWLGLPTSSSHALVGAFAGAAVAKAGSFGVIIASGWTKTLIFIVLAPMIGMVLGFFILSTRDLAFAQKLADGGRSLVSTWPACIRCGIFAWTWYERRAKNNGYYRKPTVCQPSYSKI